MNGVRTEHPHNTSDQVHAYLSEALEIVSALELTDDLRVAAFTKAVDLLAAKQIVMEAIAPGIPTMAIPRGRV